MIAGKIPNIKKATLRSVILSTVEPGSIVSTDELMSYGLLESDGYTHGTVRHGAKEYVFYDHRTGITHHVNNVESFWRLFKKSVASTHIHVSPKYMDHYLREFTFRLNHRRMQNAMFDLFDRGCLMVASMESINSAESAGVTPRAFSCRMNSSNRPVRRASNSDIISQAAPLRREQRIDIIVKLDPSRLS